MAADLGIPTSRWNSQVGVSTTVANPEASNCLAASPTDWQQKGQAGVMITASTASLRICSAIGAMASLRKSVRSH